MACVTPAKLHDPTGIPAGFNSSLRDEQILKYLEDKVTGKLDPSIDKRITTLKEENGICHTHPEKLPGVRKDGQVQYFFHPPSKAYSTGIRKRGRKRTDEDGSKARWQDIGITLPVSTGGILKGFKKILTFGPHYCCHQYHLVNDRENEDNLVVSKVFYLTQPQQCVADFRGSMMRQLAGAVVVELVRALVGELGLSLLRLCWNFIMGSLIMPLTILVTGSKLRASEQELPRKPDDANNDRGSGSDSSNADESIPKRGKLSQSNSDDGEGSSLSTIATLHHSPTSNQTETGVRRGQRMQAQTTINSGAAHMKNAAVSLQNLVKPVSNHGIVEIHGWGSGSALRSDMVPPSSLPLAEVQAWGSASCTSLPKPAQPVVFGHMYDASSSGHIFSSSGSGNQAGNFHQMGLPASRPKVEQPWPSDFTGKQNAAPMPAAQSQNPYWWQVPVSPEIAVGAQPGNQNASPRPLDQNQEPGYPSVGIGSVSMNQDMVPPSSLPPAVVQALVQALVQAWGSASCTSLPKPAQAVAFGNFHQMGLPACASCRPKFKQPWASQNAASTPAAQNQNPYWRQVPENPEMAAGAHPGNQDATPRPVDQNQEPGYPGVGIGPVSMNPNLTIYCAGSSTINFNNGSNNNVSAPRN